MAAILTNVAGLIFHYLISFGHPGPAPGEHETAFETTYLEDTHG